MSGDLMQSLIDIQRDIYLNFADTIRAFAVGGGWFDSRPSYRRRSSSEPSMR
jgi:hypothetical protein